MATCCAQVLVLLLDQRRVKRCELLRVFCGGGDVAAARRAHGACKVGDRVNVGERRRPPVERGGLFPLATFERVARGDGRLSVIRDLAVLLGGIHCGHDLRQLSHHSVRGVVLGRLQVGIDLIVERVKSLGGGVRLACRLR